MATSCDSLIARGIYANCFDPLQKGMERRGAIMNRSDIKFDSVVRDSENPINIIKTLPLNSGKVAYEILQPAKNPFAGTKSEMEEGTYTNTVSHEVSFVLLDNGPDCAAIADSILNGEFVVILENKSKRLNCASKPGSGAFQIYGFHQGLVASSISREPWSDDTRSGWMFTLKEKQAPVSGLFLWDTSYNATKTAFESLFSA